MLYVYPVQLFNDTVYSCIKVYNYINTLAKVSSPESCHNIVSHLKGKLAQSTISILQFYISVLEKHSLKMTQIHITPNTLCLNTCHLG